MISLRIFTSADNLAPTELATLLVFDTSIPANSFLVLSIKLKTLRPSSVPSLFLRKTERSNSLSLSVARRIFSVLLNIVHSSLLRFSASLVSSLEASKFLDTLSPTALDDFSAPLFDSLIALATFSATAPSISISNLAFVSLIFFNIFSKSLSVLSIKPSEKNKLPKSAIYIIVKI